MFPTVAAAHYGSASDKREFPLVSLQLLSAGFQLWDIVFEVLVRVSLFLHGFFKSYYFYFDIVIWLHHFFSLPPSKSFYISLLALFHISDHFLNYLLLYYISRIYMQIYVYKCILKSNLFNIHNASPLYVFKTNSFVYILFCFIWNHLF